MVDDVIVVRRVRRNAENVTVVISVRSSKWNNSAPTGRIFVKFGYFPKSVEKIQVSLKSDNNNGYFR